MLLLGSVFGAAVPRFIPTSHTNFAHFLGERCGFFEGSKEGVFFSFKRGYSCQWLSWLLIAKDAAASFEHVPGGIFWGVLTREDARAMCEGPVVNRPIGPFPKDIAAPVQWKKPRWLEEKICQEQNWVFHSLSVMHCFSLFYSPLFSSLIHVILSKIYERGPACPALWIISPRPLANWGRIVRWGGGCRVISLTLEYLLSRNSHLMMAVWCLKDLPALPTRRDEWATKSCTETNILPAMV